MSLRVAVFVLLFAAVACEERERADGAAPAPQKSAAAKPAAAKPLAEVPSPAGSDALAPFLATANDGRVLLSWLEPVEGKRHALKFASYQNGKWSEARTIAARDDFFVNWADFPSIISDAKGTLFAHWLQKSGPGTYAYDVHVTSSADGGKSWRPSRVLHSDGKQAEHGFVSMVARPGGGVGVIWLDGREMTGGHDGHEGHGGGAMTIRYANLDAALQTSGETLLDERVCECCTTGMAMTADGAVAVYRDRSAEEIRDIGVVRIGSAGATKPRLVHNDGWKINGCPVNGPQIDARGNELAVAWFTAAGGGSRVNVAFSNDGGNTFAKPIPVDAGKPIGRVDLQLLADGSALVTWLESGKTNASIVTRRVTRDGKLGEPKTVAATSAARGSGFPRTTINGREVWFSWTEVTTGAPKKVRVAKVTI